MTWKEAFLGPRKRARLDNDVSAIAEPHGAATAWYEIFDRMIDKDDGGLSIGMARDNGSYQFLDVPAVLLKRFCEPVEQFHLSRYFTLCTKVFGCLYQSDTENLLPEPIHCHSSSERVL